MNKKELKNKIKKRILTNVIDLFFIFIILVFDSEIKMNEVLIIFIGMVYFIIVYQTGYTFGSIFTKNKLYWYGKKTPYLFVKRHIVAIFYFFLHNSIYPLKYNLCGQYEYDVRFKTYVNNNECNKDNLNKIIELNTLAFNLRWFMFYFMIIAIIIVFIGGTIIE